MKLCWLFSFGKFLLLEMRPTWNAYRTVSNKLVESNSRSRLFRVLKIIVQSDIFKNIFTVYSPLSCSSYYWCQSSLDIFNLESNLYRIGERKKAYVFSVPFVEKHCTVFEAGTGLNSSQVRGRYTRVGREPPFPPSTHSQCLWFWQLGRLVCENHKIKRWIFFYSCTTSVQLTGINLYNQTSSTARGPK